MQILQKGEHKKCTFLMKRVEMCTQTVIKHNEVNLITQYKFYDIIE